MGAPIIEPSPEARARIGTWIRGKYRLDRILGVGGMATVYAATHRNKKRFAVKLLHTDLSNHLEVQRRFLREGYVANTVEHPGAVAVIDDDVAEDGSAFLVMELLDGETLEQIAERTPRLPLRVVLSIAHQLLGVLAAAHEKNVVHRDIKPANVFLTREGHVKVLDFGIARLQDGEGGVSMTRTGVALGTPAFMAPEQALGKSSLVDAQTDLWAVGATVLTLLSGRFVHEGETAQEQMVFAATRPAPSLAEVLPGAPARVVEVVDRALAFDKGARWPSAAAMRDAVRDLHAEIFSEGVSAGSLVAEVVAPAAEPVREATPSFTAPTEQAVVDTASLERSRVVAAGVTTPQGGRRVSVLVGGVVVLCLGGAALFARHALSTPPPAAAAEPPPAATDAAVASTPPPLEILSAEPPPTSETPAPHPLAVVKPAKPRPPAPTAPAPTQLDASAVEPAGPTPLNACGNPLGGDCAAHEYCRFERGDRCGHLHGLQGTCEPRPRSCRDIGPIVCGCDNRPYANRCTAWKSGVSVQHDGPCL